MDTSPAPSHQECSGNDPRSVNDQHLVNDYPNALVKPLPGHLYQVILPDEQAAPHQTVSHIVSRSFVRDHSAQASDSRDTSDNDTSDAADFPLAITNYCTCEDEKMSEAILSAATTDLLLSADCVHRRAVEAFLEVRRQVAARRRQSGLTYTGMRVTVTAEGPAIAEGSVAAEGPAVDGIIITTVDDDWSAPALVEVWEGEQVQPLDPAPSQRLFNHSPSGFEWGYAGSGPSQLALAMLLDFCGDPEVALLHYQEFKAQFIVALPREALRVWEIDGNEIESFLRQRGCQPPMPTKLSGDEANESSGSSQTSLAEAGEELEFSGYYGSTGRCRVYFRRDRGQSIVLVSDPPRASGTSVTNRIEVVASLACLRFRIAPERLVLIQYHAPSSLGGESFMRLSFRQRNDLQYPAWTPLTRAEATFLWGRGLPF